MQVWGCPHWPEWPRRYRFWTGKKHTSRLRVWTLSLKLWAVSFFKSSPEDTFTDLREREKGGETERERNLDVKEKH